MTTKVKKLNYIIPTTEELSLFGRSNLCQYVPPAVDPNPGGGSGGPGLS